jgi:tRNA(Arg) A34 adenosine deaminase TadA
MAADLDARDAGFLRRAIELAAAARTAGNPPFGSILVSADGQVLGEAGNSTRTDDDITAHPELKLARWAARTANRELAGGATMYTSCRPCPMCANVIARTGISRVVFGLDTANLNALKPAGYQDPDASRADYVGPHLVDEARQPLHGYY